MNMISRQDSESNRDNCTRRVPNETSRAIAWYHEGESWRVEVDGVEISIRLVARKGRRARIAIEAPAGAIFRSLGVNGEGF